MPHPDENIVCLTSRPNEQEAAIVVAALAERGIEATLGGAQAAQLLPGAFEEVEIFVLEADLPRAEHILENLDEDRTDVDWSQVDVGKPEPGEESLEDTV